MWTAGKNLSLGFQEPLWTLLCQKFIFCILSKPVTRFLPGWHFSECFVLFLFLLVWGNSLVLVRKDVQSIPWIPCWEPGKVWLALWSSLAAFFFMCWAISEDDKDLFPKKLWMRRCLCPAISEIDSSSLFVVPSSTPKWIQFYWSLPPISPFVHPEGFWCCSKPSPLWGPTCPEEEAPHAGPLRFQAHWGYKGWTGANSVSDVWEISLFAFWSHSCDWQRRAEAVSTLLMSEPVPRMFTLVGVSWRMEQCWAARRIDQPCGSCPSCWAHKLATRALIPAKGQRFWHFDQGPRFFPALKSPQKEFTCFFFSYFLPCISAAMSE